MYREAEEVQGADLKTGYKENDRVIHQKYGEGNMVCTIYDRAVVQFEEDEWNRARNVFLKELSKVEIDNRADREE